MGILFGLVAALTWGVADFCARFASHKLGNFRTVFYMQLLGFSGLSLILFFIDRPARFDWVIFGWLLVLATLNAVAVLFLYRAFEIGKLAIIAPIASAYGAITLLLGLLSGQRPSFYELLGLLVIVVGVMLASAPLALNLRQNAANSNANENEAEVPPVKKPLLAKLQVTLYNGVAFAVLAALIWGVVFWGMAFVTPTFGATWPVWVMRAVAPFVVFGLARSFRRPLSYPDSRSAWVWLVGVALFDTSAYVLYGMGLQVAESGIVAVLASLFSAVTVILAWLFIREKLAVNQWLGIVLILGGIALVGGLVK